MSRISSFYITIQPKYWRIHMNKLRDVLDTLFSAIRYSFAFCWRNDKRDTLGRLVFATLASFFSYAMVLVIGSIVNSVQSLISASAYGDVFEIVRKSDLPLHLGFLGLVLALNVVVNRVNWYFSNRWRHRLRPANSRELNDHKATLDVARFKSQEFDDMEKRIEELPASWLTRFLFAEELFVMFSSFASIIFFGSSLVKSWPLYAGILTVASIPMVFAKFRIIGGWWDLMQELVPHHKKRSVVERPYRHEGLFTQALMFHQMPVLRKQIDASWDIVMKRYDILRLVTLKGETTTNLISIAGLGIVVILTVLSTVSGLIGIGTMTVVIASARTFQGSLEDIVSRFADQWNSAKGVILIERGYFGMRPFLRTDDPVAPHFQGPPALRVENVCFSYPGRDVLVLKNISMSVKSGTIVGFVGKSGGGKTSLASLLLRHYDPSSGGIYAGDINLRNILPATWTKTASALTQDYSILDRLIGEEIASSKMDSDMNPEEVEEAARFSLFHEVVEADPKQYESQIGTEFGGREFSGGEKQRLALARVRYRKTPILILDEPDARLDPDTAQKAMENIFRLRGKVTVILITHHVSNTLGCDEVFVIDGGEIVEHGVPTDLKNQDGRYAKLFEKDKKRRIG